MIAGGDPLSEPEARHRRWPCGVLSEKARRWSRGGGSDLLISAEGVGGGVIITRVSPGSVCMSVALHPRSQSREERQDGHVLEGERGAHLPRAKERPKDERESRSTFTRGVLLSISSPPCPRSISLQTSRSSNNPGSLSLSSHGRRTIVARRPVSERGTEKAPFEPATSQFRCWRSSPREKRE